VTSGLPPRRRTPLTTADVRALLRHLAALGGATARALGRAAALVRRVDRERRFSPHARALFQDHLGVRALKTARPIGLPGCSEPFWFRAPDRLAGYQSAASLPSSADVVVIGAGLTGASAAYHLADAVRTRGLRVVVVDRGDPAGEASGRNGGNFELIPENSIGAYVGLARERLGFLRRCYPRVPTEVARAVSERQASLVLGVALRNRDLLRGIIRREGIDCDFSPRGWLHIASSDDEEQGICDEVTLAAQHGQRIEIWSRRRIREEFGFDAPSLGRFVPGDGTYHPLKYVCGLFRCAIDRGVQLFTRVGVRQVVSDGASRHRVVTDRGTIAARRVIVATNAFTGMLFPELGAIRAYQSQVLATERAPDRARGRVITSEIGPVFFNQPRAGAGGGRAPLVFGGGPDRPMANPASRRRSPAVHAHLMRLRDTFYPELRGQPPSAEWIGPMGFTPDQLPAIGFLRDGVVVAAGFNGYGGSYTTAAGCAAAHMALTSAAPDWVPADTFSPRRLLTRDPLFLSEHDGLWRVATSLCRQLKAVDREIADALTFGPRSSRAAAPPRVLKRTRGPGRSGSSVAPAVLKKLETFSAFTTRELATMLRAMRRWDCRAGTTLFAEGEPGGSCFVVVRGSVDVTIDVRGDAQRLARLAPGSIFGQMSLIVDEPRAATCSLAEDGLLLEMNRRQCERLLRGRSPLALKWLSALTDDLIAALRGADSRLMRLKRESVPGRVEYT